MVLLKFITSMNLPVVPCKSTFHYGSIKIACIPFFIFSRSSSTFHYGSIKIQAGDIITTIKNKSTFHYGSIKIR